MLRKAFEKHKNCKKFALDDINFREKTHKNFKTTMFLVLKQAN